jgi:hypothetical protein
LLLPSVSKLKLSYVFLAGCFLGLPVVREDGGGTLFHDVSKLIQDYTVSHLRI